jgi:hypothetical protein
LETSLRRLVCTRNSVEQLCDASGIKGFDVYFPSHRHVWPI